MFLDFSFNIYGCPIFPSEYKWDASISWTRAMSSGENYDQWVLRNNCMSQKVTLFLEIFNN